MNKQIFTGNYEECRAGNLISISGDRGKKVGFVGRALPMLAPKKSFWQVYHDNIGKISEVDNAKYYIEQYYNQVLSKVNIQEILENESKPILLCYEKNQQFCHRHILAEYIELTYGVEVKDIKIDENLNIEENDRPKYIGKILMDIMQKN